MTRVRVLVVALLVAATACSTAGGGSAPPTDAASGDLSTVQEWADQEAAQAALAWANQLGLADVDEALWTDRVADLCELAGRPADPDLPPSVYADLAERFVDEDAPFSVRADGSLPSTDEATDALRTVALSVCR